MNWWEDPELTSMLTAEQLDLLRRLRDAALRLKCRNKYDSLAMTVGNTLPLLIKERGVSWAKDQCGNILCLLVGPNGDRQAYRNAVDAFLRSL